VFLILSDHKNLEYFAPQAAHVPPSAAGRNTFRVQLPDSLPALDGWAPNQNALTRREDVYPRGANAYALLPTITSSPCSKLVSHARKLRS